MFYFTEVPVEALSRIRINRIALSTNSDFYNLQPKNASPGKCKRSDVVPFLPLVEDHEGLTLSRHHTPVYSAMNSIARFRRRRSMWYR